MINTDDTNLYYYNNPLIIQEDILSDHEERIDGNGYVADPNNTFGFLLESFSTIVSNCVQGIESQLNSLYPKRAQTIEDLYNHISDFDYVTFQAAPSNLSINMVFIKKFIINNALDYNSSYKLLVIPKGTVFTVGNIPFSLYYDVLIKINKHTNNILLGYDVENINPLIAIKNSDIAFKEFTYSGVEYLSFELPTYQFEKKTYNETIDTTIGFIKKYTYSDKFYAVRVFDTVNDIELEYSFSDIIYDPENITAVIKVYQDDGELEISIPQIYFTNSQISSKIKVELYTTLGAVDISIDVNNEELISAAYNVEDTDAYVDYVNALSSLPTILLTPASEKIIGGSDSSDFETIKQNVVYDLYSDKVPISNLDVENYFDQDEFKVITQVDNLTERVYYALKYIYDGNQEKLPIVNSNISINTADIIPYETYIKTFDDTNIVIMPNAVFSFDKISNKSTFLTNLEIASLYNKSTEDLITELNSKTYTRNIYHTLIINNPSNPRALSFDLISCNIENIIFQKENVYIPHQASVIDASIEHQDNGCNSYKITIGIHKSSELQEIIEDDFLVYLTCKTENNSYVGKKFTYESEYEDLFLYSVILESDYYLSENTISLINMDYIVGYTGRHEMNFTSEASISFFVKSSHVPGVAQDDEIFNDELIGTYHGNDFIAIYKQSLDITFGTNLQDVVQNTLTALYNPESYERYQENIYDTYTVDIYERNNDGTLKYEIDSVNNLVILFKLHENGEIKSYEEVPVERLDFLFDTFNNNDNTILVQFESNYVIKFRKGDIKFDGLGNPILVSDRILNFTIETFQLDLKYYFVELFDLNYIYGLLRIYYDKILEKEQNLYGNTLCFYRPINTLGYGVFGNSLSENIEIDLDISLGFKIYLHSYLLKDETFIFDLKKNITSIVKNNLENNVFSLISISGEIKNQFPDYVQNVDIKGINDDISLQVLIKVSNENNINIKKELFITDDNTVDIQDDISIDFIEVA